MATLQTFGMTGSPAVTFPANRQPIVETLSVQVDVSPPGSKLEAFVNYTSAGQNVSLFVPLTYAYTELGTNFDFYVAALAVRLYPDKGTSMVVSIHSPTGHGGTLFLTVSGQFA
jgi:hypothetical protein